MEIKQEDIEKYKKFFEMREHKYFPVPFEFLDIEGYKFNAKMTNLLHSSRFKKASEYITTKEIIKECVFIDKIMNDEQTLYFKIGYNPDNTNKGFLRDGQFAVFSKPLHLRKEAILFIYTAGDFNVSIKNKILDKRFINEQSSTVAIRIKNEKELESILEKIERLELFKDIDTSLNTAHDIQQELFGNSFHEDIMFSYKEFLKEESLPRGVNSLSSSTIYLKSIADGRYDIRLVDAKDYINIYNANGGLS